MNLFLKVFLAASLGLGLSVQARLTYEATHPSNEALVNKLRGYYTTIDSLGIRDIGGRIKIEQKAIDSDYLPTNDPECNGYWITIDGEVALPYVAWALGNKFFREMSQQQLVDTPVYLAYLRMFRKAHNNRIVDCSQLSDKYYLEKVRTECSSADKLSGLYEQVKGLCDAYWRTYVGGPFPVSSSHAMTATPVQLAAVSHKGGAAKADGARTMAQDKAIMPDRLTYTDILNDNIQLTTNKCANALIQISDTHEYNAAQLAKVVDKVRERLKDKNVKVIVVGDIANKDVTKVGHEYLQKRILRAGDYFVTGNHDAHRTDSYKEYIQTLHKEGIHWLSNSAISSLTGYHNDLDKYGTQLSAATFGNGIVIGDCPTQHCYGLTEEIVNSKGKLQYANNIDQQEYIQKGTSGYNKKWYHQSGLYYAPLYAAQYDGPWKTQSQKFSFSKMIKTYLGLPRLINHYPDISTDDKRKNRCPKSLLQRLDLNMCKPFNKNPDSKSDWTTAEDSYNLFALTQYVQLMYAIAQQINSHPGDEIITVNFAWHDAGLSLYYVLQQMSAIIYADALDQNYATYVNEDNKSANRGRFVLYCDDNKRFLKRLIPGLRGSLISDSSQLKRVQLNITAGHDHNEAIKSLQALWSCFNLYQSSYFKGLNPGGNGVLVGSLPICCAGNVVVDLPVTSASCSSPGHSHQQDVDNRDLYVWYYN